MDTDNGKHGLGSEYVEWLKQNGEEVHAKAVEGNGTAKNIVAIYGLYYTRPDHAAAAILEVLIDEFKKRNE